MILVVHPSSPAKTVQDFVAQAKANPGKLNFGHAGAGNVTHLTGEMFRSLAKIEFLGVPHRGGAESITSLLGQQVDFLFESPVVLLPLIRDGKLRALGVTSATRVPTASELPTLAEAGVPGYEAVAWLMVVTRAGLPAEVLARLHRELKDVLAQPEVKQQIARYGMIPVDSPPPHELQRYIGTETARWREIVQKAGALGIE
jgi:tripartite-type tricarboxylate transporter receptor subunit TctC